MHGDQKKFKQFVHIKRGLRHKKTRATSKLRGEMLLSNLCSCQVIDSKAQKNCLVWKNWQLSEREQSHVSEDLFTLYSHGIRIIFALVHCQDSGTAWARSTWNPWALKLQTTWEKSPSYVNPWCGTVSLTFELWASQAWSWMMWWNW